VYKRQNFFYLNDRERASVMGNACKLLTDEGLMEPGSFYYANRRSRIMRNLLEYLESEKELNIEGFVNFRLNGYINELNDTIERALEIFVAEREYNEFIKLLRYFVEIQECKIETVHLSQSKDGRYLLYDDSKNRISSEYFDELRSEILDDTINYDDLLISTLITISPNKIIIHDVNEFKNKELVQTIMNVFTERITISSSCDLCSSPMESKESNKYSL
jgi:putative sporulation protein YtxC